MKLDKKFKAAWLKKLLSGNYRQTTGCLKDKIFSRPRYCCLGVAGCVLKEMGLAEWDEEDCIVSKLNLQFRDNCILPTDLADKIGITRETQNTLTKMNDDFEKNFQEIAEYIKKNL